MAEAPTPIEQLEDLVEKFSNALLKKLKLSHANGKRGWAKEDWVQECQLGLIRHVSKGDPLDVAAYCAFMWHHGWAVATAEEVAIEAVQELKDKALMSKRRVAVVTGGSSGLGKAVIEQLLVGQTFTHVINWSLDTLVDVRYEDSVRGAASKLLAQFDGKIDVLVQAAGVNHIEAIPALEVDSWDRIMDTNCRGLWLTVKHLAEALRGGSVCNIVSNAAKIPMTSSIAYNSSKAAALMLSKQMARELGKTHDITVFSVSPNKLTNTSMSDYINAEVCRQRGWTPEEALAYQLASLPAGVETDTTTLAEFIAFLLSKKQRHLYLQGCDLTYGGPV